MCAAGACYGFAIPLVRTIYAQGLTVSEIMAFQYFAGVIALVIIAVLFSRHAVSLKDCFRLLGVGVLASGVSFFYYCAIDLLPSATAVTLLFQFVWMGVVLQTIRERTLPHTETVLSVVVIMLGTILATGVLEQDAHAATSLDPLGILCGLLSAVFYTAFLFTSGKTATHLPALNRTLFTTTGSLIVALVLCPTFFTGTLAPHLADPGLLLLTLVLGLTGIVLPVVLIASSSPHLPSSISNIMASTELPSGIICAWLFMGDAISPFIALGVILILAGIVLSQRRDLRAYLKKTPN